MIRFYATLFTALAGCTVHAQSFSLNDLVGYTAYTPTRFENSVEKRGYRTAGFEASADSRTYTWRTSKSNDVTEKAIAKSDRQDKATIAFQTTSAEEAAALSRQLKEEGYHFAEGAKIQLYQKSNITIRPVKTVNGAKTVYSFVIERHALPRAKDMVHAEDFLQFTSHEHLAAVFGDEFLKRDVFHFSETETTQCSVLYPNTSMQVIFIWKDEDNRRDLAFLLIGGQLQVQSALAYHKQVEQNIWQSRQGIYSGMSLRELEQLNGAPISLWGWQSEQPGVVDSKNTGAIRFKEISVVLNCLDCNEDKFYSNNKLLNSEDVLREGRRVYVSTIVIVPPAK